MKVRILLVLGVAIFVSACSAETTKPTPTTAPATQLSTSTAIPPTAVPTMTATHEADPAEMLSDLPAGQWTEIEPGGETRCAHNTDFSFWARPGKVDKLLVYYEGGGGCWSAESCAIGSQLYDASVSGKDDPNFHKEGVFDLDNPLNPFADYSAVFIPSCTGDVFLGDSVHVYDDEENGDLEIYHRGFVNSQAALDWTFEHVAEPESVFVTGCSAGSIGSIQASPFLIEAYPQAHFAQLGDSLTFAFGEGININSVYQSHKNFADWIPASAELDPDNFWMWELYAAYASYYPDRTFSQFNYWADNVQMRFFAAPGTTNETFHATMAKELALIHDNAPNFRTFTAPGQKHCILPRDSFYNLSVDGVAFTDWVAALAAGESVENVQCEDCLVLE